MKSRGDIAVWLEKELSYDASGEKECPTCGRGGYTYWIDHRSSLVGNLLVFLELSPPHRFASGAIYGALDGVLEDARVTGNAKNDAPILAETICKVLGWIEC